MTSTTGRHVTVFRNGPVFRADAAGSFADAVAVVDGRIAAVGGATQVAAYLVRADAVVDLDGRLLVPGFVDAHAHPIQGGMERGRCDLSEVFGAAASRQAIAEYAHRHPDREWILGGGWSMSDFPGGCPTLDQIDPAVGGRPAYLPNRDHHSAWVSSRALAIAGIDRDTPDPADGRIERDADGEPSGVLHEGAMDLVARHLPADTQEDYDTGLREAQRYLHSLGVVGWQDAKVDGGAAGPSAHESYLRAERAGRLTARVTGALWWERSCPAERIPDQVAELVRLRDQAAGRYRPTSVKIMQDGVIETFTASVLEPYLDRCGHPSGNSGLRFLEPGLLGQAVTALDAAGFQIHFHALADLAVRDVLDALEAARAANGTADRRHHLAHLQLVDPVDLPRFRALGAWANLQALWAQHEPQMDELTIPFLGPERAGRQYPFGDLFRLGTSLAMGSDWPVSSPDPVQGIHVAVNRAAAGAGHDTPVLGPAQRLPLAVALTAYTAGSAAINHLEDRTGSIRAGLEADLVVLDRNPFDGDPALIGKTGVHRTYVAGELVHNSE